MFSTKIPHFCILINHRIFSFSTKSENEMAGFGQTYHIIFPGTEE
jgi:hypothetical protein